MNGYMVGEVNNHFTHAQDKDASILGLPPCIQDSSTKKSDSTEKLLEIALKEAGGKYQKLEHRVEPRTMLVLLYKLHNCAWAFPLMWSGR